METTPATNQEDSVTIDNIEYKISDLTESQQRLIGIYKQWKEDEMAAQLEVMKLQAAQKEIAREVVIDVRRTLEATAEEAKKKEPLSSVVTTETEETTPPVTPANE